MTVIDTVTARARAESLMSSTCRIYTVGAPVTDPESGEVTRVEVDPVETVCRVRPNGNLDRGAEAGGAELIASGYVVSVPFAVNAVVQQRLIVTDSPDPSLIGLSLEVRQVARGDNISARRLLCEEVS